MWIVTFITFGSSGQTYIASMKGISNDALRGPYCLGMCRIRLFFHFQGGCGVLRYNQAFWIPEIQGRIDRHIRLVPDYRSDHISSFFWPTPGSLTSSATVDSDFATENFDHHLPKPEEMLVLLSWIRDRSDIRKELQYFQTLEAMPKMCRGVGKARNKSGGYLFNPLVSVTLCQKSTTATNSLKWDFRTEVRLSN